MRLLHGCINKLILSKKTSYNICILPVASVFLLILTLTGAKSQTFAATHEGNPFMLSGKGVSSEITVFGLDTGHALEMGLIMYPDQPFTNKDGFCFLTGNEDTSTGIPMSARVSDDGPDGQWTIYWSDGRANVASRNATHSAMYFRCVSLN